MSTADRTSRLSDRLGRLLKWLQARMPYATNLAVSGLNASSSGFTNETYFFDLCWDEADARHEEHLVLRLEPEGQALFPHYDLGLQFNVMRCLAPTSIPVPRVWWLEQRAEVLDRPFYVMERMDGVTASGFRPGFHGHGLFFEASIERRRAMWWRAVDTMIAVHALDWRAIGVGEYLGRPANGQDAIAYGIAQMKSWLDWAQAEPLPVIHAGLRWLEERGYEPARLVLCWGDVRPGNMLYRDDAVVAALDWEHALIGPPEFDLAYFVLVDLITAEINQVPRLAGIPEGPETIAYYERLSGHKTFNYAYAEVFQAVRMAVFLVLTVKLSPSHLKMPADFATNNIPTRRITELIGLV